MHHILLPPFFGSLLFYHKQNFLSMLKFCHITPTPLKILTLRKLYFLSSTAGLCQTNYRTPSPKRFNKSNSDILFCALSHKAIKNDVISNKYQRRFLFNAFKACLINSKFKSQNRDKPIDCFMKPCYNEKKSDFLILF